MVACAGELKGEEINMQYRDEIRPWAVFKRQPSGGNVLVDRFRSRSDADAYASILRWDGNVYTVAFDKPIQPQSQLNQISR